jgi:sugar phosphate isomerase/epimerase
MIKIGCNYLSLRDTSVEDFIRTAYELRLDVVDFHQRAFESTDPDYLGSVKALCLRYGLPIGYIGVSGLFHGTAAEREGHVKNSKEAVDLAAFLGSPIIRMFCAVIPETNGDGEDPWPGMIAGYQEVADYAATKGIAVGLQNHPTTGDVMLRIRSETNRENFNFIMDTGQWIGSPGAGPRGETDPNVNFYGFMEQTAPHAMYIRTKFYEIESGKEEWIDYERIVPIIKQVNYNGCISIVYEGEQEDRVEQVRLAAAYLRELLAGY